MGSGRRGVDEQVQVVVWCSLAAVLSAVSQQFQRQLTALSCRLSLVLGRACLLPKPSAAQSAASALLSPGHTTRILPSPTRPPDPRPLPRPPCHLPPARPSRCRAPVRRPPTPSPPPNHLVRAASFYHQASLLPPRRQPSEQLPLLAAYRVLCRHRRHRLHCCCCCCCSPPRLSVHRRPPCLHAASSLTGSHSQPAPNVRSTLPARRTRRYIHRQHLSTTLPAPTTWLLPPPSPSRCVQLRDSFYPHRSLLTTPSVSLPVTVPSAK